MYIWSQPILYCSAAFKKGVQSGISSREKSRYTTTDKRSRTFSSSSKSAVSKEVAPHIALDCHVNDSIGSVLDWRERSSGLLSGDIVMPHVFLLEMLTVLDVTTRSFYAGTRTMWTSSVVNYPC